MNSISNKEQIALVTGASKGIGKAIALAFAQEGFKVGICGRNPKDLEATKKSIEETGSKCSAIVCDIQNEGEVIALVNSINRSLGPVSYLINNAGIHATQPVQGHPVSLWHEIININLTGAMLASKHCLDSMISQNFGRIINISSISGIRGEIWSSAYSASKFGMIGLTQSLALEVAKHHITVNAICPGWVQTQMSNEQMEDKDWCQLNNLDPNEAVELTKLSVPQMRFIDPQEIASLALYLCSDKACSITGQAISICGGLSL